VFALISHTDVLFTLVAFLAMAAAAGTAARSFDGAVVSSTIRAQAGITVIYSEPGDGKTYLMSEFEGAFFFPLEDGTAGFSPDYKVKFFTHPAPREGVIPSPIIPKTYAEFTALVRRFIATNVPPSLGERKPYGYLMIDGLSPLEQLVHAETCRRAESSSMEDKFGMWTASLAVWAEVWALLEDVRNRGVHVWIAAHAADEPAATIAGETYRRKTIRMLTGGNKNAPDFSGMVMGRVDNVWFLARDVSVTPGSRGRRAAARYGGRVIYTQPTREIGGASYRAKSRRTMPAKVPATPIDIRRAMAAGISRPAEKILADLALVLPLLPEAAQKEIGAEVDKHRTNPNALASLLSRAQGMRASQEEEDEPEERTEGAAPDMPGQAPASAVQPVTASKPEAAAQAQAPAESLPPADDDGPPDVPGAASGAAPGAPAPPTALPALDLDPIIKASDAGAVTVALEHLLGKTPYIPELRSAILTTAYSRLLDLAKVERDCGRVSGMLQSRIEQGEHIEPGALTDLHKRIDERRRMLAQKAG
jgi:AAA domain-containing protein